MKFLRIISIVVSTVLVLGTLAWLVYQNMVPGGVLVMHWQPDKPSALIGPVVPESRLLPLGMAGDGTLYKSIVEEPVNFDVRMPLSFDTATVRVKVGGGPAIVELGGLVSRETWANDLRPGTNRIIDELKWPAITDGEMTLYQRAATYKTIADFLNNIPAAGAAAYRADVGPRIRLSGYAPQAAERVYKTAFRGPTTIKAYLQNEPLDFAFKVQEANRHVGADNFKAVAMIDGKEVARAEYADDGNEGAGGKLSVIADLVLKTDKPLTGTVVIKLPAGDDVFFRETKTAQGKFVFAGRFYAADHVGYLKEPPPVSLVTNGRRLYAATAHPEAFQAVKVGNGELVIDDLNRPFSVSTSADLRKYGVVTVDLPYGDVRLETAGVFAFTRDNFWNPDLQPVTWETDIDADGINYLLTAYRPPAYAGEWRTIESTFDLKKLSVKNRAANFAVSVPGIELQQKELKIASIDVVLRRAPLRREDIWPALQKVWNQLVGREQEFINSLKN